MPKNSISLFHLLVLLSLIVGPQLLIAQVTVQQALQLVPVQKQDVEFSTPGSEELEECSLSSPADKKLNGWIVKDPAGRLLRRFLDTNGDQDIDLWCYYRDGFEVYRDIDSNFDRKADQYRWYGSQGTRWGVDVDQDGIVDRWKRISAEEVSEEVAKALIDRNQEKFERLLITADELENVGFGSSKITELVKTLGQSKTAFSQLIRQNRGLEEASWLHFGGLRPGLLPEGTDGATKDIVIYENVASLIRSGSKNMQVSLGTMIQIDGCWRLIDAPEIIDEKSTSSFASWYRATEGSEANLSSLRPGSSAYQRLLEDFQTLDQKLESALTQSAKKEIYPDLASTISQLAIEAEGEDSLNWSRQFADTVTAAIQTNEFPDGLSSLQAFIRLLKKEKKSKESIALVTYRYINADFGAKLNDPKTDVAEAQSEWLAQLKQFTEDFPRDENAPDAMMQLAMADEFEGKKSDAEKWYQTISSNFGDSPYAGKAEGAIRRLNSIGKKITLRGRSLLGKQVDLQDFEGRFVLVHYWADWCEICKDEFTKLAKLQKQYPDLRLLGVNCDSELKAAQRALSTLNVDWPHLHSQGGYNKGFAAEMGIVSLPTMILIGKNGKVISTTVSAATLEREIRTLLE